MFLQVASIMLVSILRMSFMNHIGFFKKKVVKNICQLKQIPQYVIVNFQQVFISRL
jgi:hypothetical protein